MLSFLEECKAKTMLMDSVDTRPLEMWEKAIKCKFDDIDASEDVNNSCTLVEIDLVTNMTSLSIPDLCPGGNSTVI